MFPADQQVAAGRRATKTQGRASGLRAPDLDERVAFDSASERKLERDLRRTYELRRFLLHYQPIVDVRTRRIVSAEALIRWKDPERGLVPPTTFIPLLESTGLIVSVGEWAVREAAATCRRWREAGCAPIRIRVNVSPSQLRRPAFVDTFLAIVAGWSDADYGLDVDLTEGKFEDPQRLARLRSAGVRIAIDESGTEYSSLARLTAFPVDILRIGRSITSQVVDDPRAADVVSMIVGLAYRFGATTVAEGVETEAQFKRLRGIGCDCSQGFLHSQARSAAELEALLRCASGAPSASAAARARG